MIAALRLIATAVVGLVICISLVACGEEKQQQEGAMNTASAKIEGSVSYRERMALPPDAEIEVVFEDVSRVDAPSKVLATLILNAKKGPPYPFAIDYKPADIDARMTYALRATIRVDGKMIFTTMDYIDPFLGNPVTVLVRRVPGGK